MKEQEKEAFLKAFDETNEGTLVGFCVMGGIFGEGIDLRAERLMPLSCSIALRTSQV